MLVLVVAVFVLTRTGVTRLMVIPHLEAALNVDIEASSLVLNPNGTIVLRNVRLRASDVEGPAATFLEVPRASARVEWRGLLAGEPVVRRVDLYQPLARISEEIDTGRLNVGELTLLKDDRPDDPDRRIPTLIAHDATLELGEHRGRDYTPLRRVRVDGQLTQDRDSDEPRYLVSLRERLPEGRDDEPMVVEGKVGSGAMGFTFQRIVLDDWPAESVPSSLRGLLQLMSMEGRLSHSRVEYTERDGLSVEIFLDDVSVTLPFDARGQYGGPGPLARMRGVRGSVIFDQRGVRADFDGVIEDLPYRVQLEYQGRGRDAPFRGRIITEGFELDEHPDLLPFAPDVVEDRLATFSNPTATVDADVIIERGPGRWGRAAPVDVRGRVRIRNGAASYVGFPYRFTDLSGEIDFDNDTITIRRITGKGPSGAELTVTGRIEPPTAVAEVDLDITARNVPIDEVLLGGMNPAQRDVVESVFSEEEASRLIDSGLVLPLDEAERLTSQRRELHETLEDPPVLDGDPSQLRVAMSAIDEQLETPVFQLGGTCDITVRVHRELGEASRWSHGIDVRIERADFLPEQFPYPLRAEGVTLSIQDGRASLHGGKVRGLTGAQVRVDALVELPTGRRAPGDESRDHQLIRRIGVDADEIPPDGLALHATARAMDRAGAAAADRIAQIVNALRPDGMLSAGVRIEPDEDERLDYAITVRPGEGFRLGPFDTGRDNETLTLRVDQMDIDLDRRYAKLGAELLPVRSGQPPEEGRPIELGAAVEVSGERAGAYHFEVLAESYDVAIPIERILRDVLGEAAPDLAQLRERHQPSGRLTAHLVAEGAPGSAFDPMLQITDAEDLALTTDFGRVTLSDSSGWVFFRPSRGLVFDAFEADLSTQDARAGRLRLEGGLPTEAADAEARARLDPLRLRLEGAAWQSPLAQTLVQRFGGERAGSAYNEASPRGRFDATAAWRAGVGLDEITSAAPEDVSLRPHSLHLRLGEREIRIPRMDGAVHLGEPRAGRFEGLTLAGDDWQWAFDGTWTIDDADALSIETRGSGESEGLPDEMTALLPSAVSGVLDQLEIRAGGRVEGEVERLAVRWPAGNDGSTIETHTAGRVRFEAASGQVGVPFTHAGGLVRFEAEQSADQSRARYAVELDIDRMLVQGVRVREARARIVSGDEPGGVLVPELTGLCHGGRIAGRAVLFTTSDATRYTLEILGAGIRFTDVLNDLRQEHDALATDQPAPTPETEDAPPIRHPGPELTFSLDLTGTPGDPASRRGRGSAQVGGGTILDLPLVVPLVQVSNLQLPSGAGLDLALAGFHIDGELLTFDELSAFGDNIEIFGYGTMRWPSLDLDLRFNSRAVRPIPLLSELVEGIRNELITTRITGPLGEHRVRPVQFEGARRMLGRMVGGRSDEVVRLAEIERRAMESRERVRRAGERVRRMSELGPTGAGGPGRGASGTSSSDRD